MENNYSWLFIVLIILSIWFWEDHKNLENKLGESQNELSYCQDELQTSQDESQTYQDALDEANSNIEDAQSYAWSTYDDMGYALDDLLTVNP